MAGLTPDQIVEGILLRVIPERWDAPAGTIARVTGVGHAGVQQAWCCHLEWLNRPKEYGGNGHGGLNYFEEDLQDFEIHTGPIVQPPDRKQRRGRAMIPRTTTEQLCLPYGHDDTIPDTAANSCFYLHTRAAWDFDMDV